MQLTRKRRTSIAPPALAALLTALIGVLAASAPLGAQDAAMLRTGSTEIHPPSAVQPGAARPAVDIANGRFFVSGEDEVGMTGFAVIDEPLGPPFWSTYQLLGGAEAVGLPLTRPFGLPDAHVYQLFEYALLRWLPGAPLAGIASTLDLMSAAGRDDWLVENGVPRAAPVDGRPADQALLERIGWLSDGAIRDAYFGAVYPESDPGFAAAVLRLGLPAAPPERDGAGVTQRFERTALRLDSATGTVAALPVGSFLLRSGLLPGTPQAPDHLVGTQLVARAPRAMVAWANARGWGVPEAAASGAPAGPAAAVPEGIATPVPAAAPTAGAPAREAPSATPFASAGATPGGPPAGAPLQPGAVLAIRAIVNDGRAEHVVIANEGSAPQELTGWTLRSGTGGQQLTLPAGFVLLPGAIVRVHSGAGAPAQNRPPTDVVATSANVWNNQGDTALLVDPTGRVVHQLTYGG